MAQSKDIFQQGHIHRDEQARPFKGEEPCLKELPVSLYIHVPWCLKKCPYCDFSSEVSKGRLPEAAFFAALQRDLDTALSQFPIGRFVSVFFGGGTPSLLSSSAIGQFLGKLRQYRLINDQTEVTLEANPATIEHGNFLDLIDAGVNRISLGVQSFNDSLLKKIGRIHNARQALDAIESAMAACDRVSIDLMYGLPEQGLNDLEDDLARIEKLGIHHVSLYQLTIEEETPFGRNPPKKMASEDIIEQMERLIQQRLSKMGFEQYETSAFAKHNQYCAHNLNYWHFGDYLGIGPGAHGKLSRPEGVFRQSRAFSVANYLSADAVSIESCLLTNKDCLIESIMNAGRLTNGFSVAMLARNARLPVAHFESIIDYAVSNHYWHYENEWVMPTEKGRRFLNQLLCEIMPE